MEEEKKGTKISGQKGSPEEGERGRTTKKVEQVPFEKTGSVDLVPVEIKGEGSTH